MLVRSQRLLVAPDSQPQLARRLVSRNPGRARLPGVELCSFQSDGMDKKKRHLVAFVLCRIGSGTQDVGGNLRRPVSSPGQLFEFGDGLANRSERLRGSAHPRGLGGRIPPTEVDRPDVGVRILGEEEDEEQNHR